jgi:hypothetical protein
VAVNTIPCTRTVAPAEMCTPKKFDLQIASRQFRRGQANRSGDDPETDSVKEHAMAPFRSGPLPTAA